MENASLNRWIGTALSLLLLLVLTLAWLGFSASRTQDRMVREVLQDYAQLIADNYVSALHTEIGFKRLYPLSQRLDTSGLLEGETETWDQTDVQGLVKEYLGMNALRSSFFVDGETQSVQWLFNDHAEARLFVKDYLDQLAADISPPFEVRHIISAGQTQTILIIPTDAGQTVLWLEQESLPFWFETVFKEVVLLPEVLGNPDALRPHIHITVSDSLSAPIFQSNTVFIQNLASSATISGEYAGLFKDFEVSVSIHPSIASELVIGDLPYGRLPFIVLLLIVAVVLGAVSFKLLRKQRQLLELRTDFVARVSHELRTPLTQIRMFTESLMLERLNKSEDRQMALKVIHRETGRLTRLVDNILLFEQQGQIELKPEMQPFLVAKLFHQLQEDFQLILDSKETVLDVRCPDELYSRCNRTALVQILTNLLDNALKYGQKGQRISMEAEQTDQQLVIKVCDQGPGIPEAEREKIFEAYYRLEKEKKEAIAGTGIGLSVSRELANDIGGILYFESKPEGGGCFVLSATEVP